MNKLNSTDYYCIDCNIKLLGTLDKHDHLKYYQCPKCKRKITIKRIYLDLENLK